EIAERAPDVREGINELLVAAEAKRAEALRLLEEADRLASQPRRLLNWLDRYVTVTDPDSGEQHKASHLGPIQFDVLAPPLPQPAPELFQKIAGLTPHEVVAVGGDELTDEELEAIHNA